MPHTINTNFKIQAIIWLLFCLIAFGLGYATLARYNPALLQSVSDSKIYYNLVKHGIAGINSDHRSSRILVPFLARGFYFLLDGKTGAWDPILLSMLIINSIFCSSLALLIFKIASNFTKNATIGLLAAFLFFANFAMTNLYLSGLVDSAEAFFILLSIYYLFKGAWGKVIPIALLGALSKETFLPIMSVFYGTWWLVTSYENGRYNLLPLVYIIVSICSMFFVIVILKSFSYHQLMLPWKYASVLKTKDIHTTGWYLRELRRFCYVFIFLTPLAIPNLMQLPRRWLIASGVSSLAIVFLTAWAGGSGSALARYLFNLTGSLLSISAAIYLYDLTKNYNLTQRIA